MSLPFVCRACRAKQVIPHVGTRYFTTGPSTRLQTPAARTGRRDGGADNERRIYQNLETPLKYPDSNGTSDGRIRGRYSGKELSPEQLLAQVDQPWQSRVAAHRPPVRKSTPVRSHPSQAPNQITPKRSLRREEPMSAALSASSRSFIEHTNSEDLPQAWSVLQLLAQECEKVSSIQITSLLRSPDFVPAMQKFIWACIRQWLVSLPTGSHSSSLPCPRDVFRILYVMQTAKPSFLRPALWQTATGICDAYANNLSATRLNNAVCELAEMWRLCMALQHGRNSSKQTFEGDSGNSKSAYDVSATDGTDWSFLTRVVSGEPQTQRTFAEVLTDFVPVSKRDLLSKDVRRTDYASAALLTLDLFRDSGVRCEVSENLASSRQSQCTPFVNFLESILKITSKPQIPFGLREKLASVEDEVLRRYYTAAVHRLNLDNTKVDTEFNAEPLEGTATRKVADMASRGENVMASDASEEPVNTDFSQAVSPQAARFAKDNIKRLFRAMAQHDMYLAEKIRKEVFALAGTNNNDPNALPLELYEQLMLTFLSLRNPKVAIETWNHIIQTGYTPTVKTYTVMMQGARASRDLSGMEAFWQKMRGAGFQPDEHAWSVRVFGLLTLKRVQRGLQALSEMGQEWIAAAKDQALVDMKPSQRKQIASNTNSASQLLSAYPGPVGQVPRPNLVVMNSAISALASSGEQEIPKVLMWGRSFGIEPDVITYNALLNIAMRHGQADEALNILRRMHNRGVAANSTTWTVLLTALFHGGFLDDLDHTQQQDKILQFIRSLEDPASGIQGIDDKAYALIIDRLLKVHNNTSGATAVLSHMTATGRTPSLYIHTILMSSYFQQVPKPDFAAIESLWKQLQAQNSGYGAPLDNVFYDRMIEGYATHHRITGMQPALGFLKRARQAGQKPGWRALSAVARALAERQDVNRLRALVDDVRVSLREARGATQHIGQEEFWSLIIETGLLNEEGITRPEQILPAKARASPLVQAADV